MLRGFGDFTRYAACTLAALALAGAAAWAGPAGGKTANAFLEEVRGLQNSAPVNAQPKRWRLEVERIARALVAQQAAWNRGDTDAFMTGYWRNDALRFATGNTVTTGWQLARERYRIRYDRREKMGTLSYSGLDIRVLSDDVAVVFGRWKLEHGGDALNGLFTLLLRKIGGRWVIVHDHTSSE